ncbi:MAG: ABC transporter permease, partial [Anaerolineae bacterium]|nr:ABC transporter permease [Anaerolineae bacterium]
SLDADSNDSPEMTLGDYQAIADPFLVPDVTGTAPELSAEGDISAGKKDLYTGVVGVTPEYLALRHLQVADGTFISSDDVSAKSRVVVLGHKLYQKLFDDGAYAIGQKIKINRVPFRVIGVLAEKGGSTLDGADDSVYVPLTTVQARLYPWMRSRRGEPLLSTIYVQVVDETVVDPVSENIADLLRQRHKIAFRDEDDFSIVKQTDILSITGNMTRALTVFLGAIAGVSLLVGGIGIMNIMLVSVTERTREIGVRKAMGARRRDIRIQFLVEAIVLALLGGAIGIALGAAGSHLIAALAKDLDTVVSWQTVLLATGFSAAVGVFFGIYPSNRAAGLNPIDALRYE